MKLIIDRGLGEGDTLSISDILLLAHPVGSYYWSDDSTNPSELFGGVWEQIEDRFLLACGSTYKNGTTGGEAAHTLTVNELARHNHQIAGNNDGEEPNQYSAPTGNLAAYETRVNRQYWSYTKHWKLVNTTEAGGNQPHNNMPPYLCAYCWKRTK